MPRKFSPSILTANDLLEGDVIYYTDDGEWTRAFEHAKIFEIEREAATALALATADEARLVGAYLTTIDTDEDGPKPAHFREDFRATGPSNYHHGKQEAQDV